MARGTLSRPSLNISKGDDYHHSQNQQQWSDSDDGGSDSGESEAEDCPLCLEEMDESDVRFIPCPCGYQVNEKMSLFFLIFLW